MRILFWVLTALSMLVAADFAVSNRDTIELALWPLPDALPVPAYLVVLVALAVGFTIGLLFSWAAHWPVRRERRRHQRRVGVLEAELAKLRPAAPAEPTEPRLPVA